MSSYGLWLSAAGMKVNEHRQTVLANNMANVNTTGFKHDLAVVSQRLVESEASPGGFGFAHPVLDGLPGGVNVRPTYTNFGQGRLEQTGRALDVAIKGEGFFAVSDGKVTRYTRDGRFTVNAAGEVVLAAGEGRWTVLDDEGAPIVIDRTAGKVTVSEDGTIRQEGKAVATLGLMSAEDKQSLIKVGGNLFEARGVDMIPVKGSFVPGFLEASNFDIMRGLVAMIEGARAYQINGRMVQLQDQLTKQAVLTVGRVG